MQIKKKSNKLNKLYIIFFPLVLFIIIFFSTTSLNAKSFKVTNLEISEEFGLNFNKENVVDKGFKKAFDELISMITTSGDKEKIKNIPLLTIKSLIESFTISEEKFVNNEYKTKFDVTFNKKNTLDFFEKNQIFPSIPKKKKLLLIPLLVDLQLDQIFLFNNNIFYQNWNKDTESYFLIEYLLPSEDIEDINLLLKNSKSIEDYDFKEIIKKYDLEDFIIVIIFKNKNNFRVLSKIKLEDSFKIYNQKFEKINFSNIEEIKTIIFNLKNNYEDSWKIINQINTSIKLPLTVSINAKEYKKIQNLENVFNELDLISSFKILNFDNQNIYYRLIYNGSPKKFINEMTDKNIKINTENKIWKIQ